MIKNMQNWIKVVQEIRAANQNNMLVIFVGAGVSINSGIPTWQKLVEEYATIIGYKGKKDSNQFTQEELLKIPEYVYSSTKFKSFYYSTLKKYFDANTYTPNAIDKLIFDIRPHHIITTNFDTLLEDTISENVPLYKVIYEDKDLLKSSNNQYLIKMHGDIKHKTALVLKESDYIDYEQTHTLISTYIKSLLVDHTFIFIGYSLSDYNLNLIIGWINYFSKTLKIKTRPKNFLITIEDISKFEKQRYKSKNITVFSLSDLPNDITEKCTGSEKLKNLAGQKLFSFLYAIYNSSVLISYLPAEKIITEDLQQLIAYNRISYEDLTASYNFGHTEYNKAKLFIYNQNEFNNLSKILSNEESEVYKLFQKTGIQEIHYLFNSSTGITIKPNEIDIFLQLYLNNDYNTLYEEIEKAEPAVKICYSPFYNIPIKKLREFTEQDGIKSQNKGKISILMHLIRDYLIDFNITLKKAKGNNVQRFIQTFSQSELNRTKFIRNMFENNMRYDKAEMCNKLNIIENKYLQYDSKNIYLGEAHEELFFLQAKVYEYYFFIKLNYLPFDYFYNPSIYFNSYINAILCTYTPQQRKENKAIKFTEGTPYPYMINTIDLDIITKYISPVKLKNSIARYRVKKIFCKNNLNIGILYSNICNSFNNIQIVKFPKIAEQVNNLSKIISLLEIDQDIKESCAKLLLNIFSHNIESNYNMSVLIIDGLYDLLSCLTSHKLRTCFMKKILKPDIYAKIINDVRYNQIILSSLSVFSEDVDDESKSNIKIYIDTLHGKTKIDELYNMKNIISLKEYADYINKNINLLSNKQLFYAIIYKIVLPSEKIINFFIDSIEKNILYDENTNYYVYPDPIEENINHLIIISLLYKDFDIKVLHKYKDFSHPLKFILDPANFDYSNIDPDDYMWDNIFRLGQFQKEFVSHKSQMPSKAQEWLEQELFRISKTHKD